MYTPTAFREERLPVLHDLIRQAPLAALVTLGDDGLEATHVPLLLEPGEGPYGTLYGHLARANPQGQGLVSSLPGLAIFTGPEAYISPDWFPSKALTGKAVPTWNYIAVHATGPLEFFDELDRLRELVTRLTERHEANRPEPWAVSDAPEDYVQAMLSAIIGFRLPITRLDGKWKLSQNRTEEDRQGVIDGLTRETTAGNTAVAEIMSPKV